LNTITLNKKGSTVGEVIVIVFLILIFSIGIFEIALLIYAYTHSDEVKCNLIWCEFTTTKQVSNLHCYNQSGIKNCSKEEIKYAQQYQINYSTEPTYVNMYFVSPNCTYTNDSAICNYYSKQLISEELNNDSINPYSNIPFENCTDDCLKEFVGNLITKEMLN